MERPEFLCMLDELLELEPGTLKGEEKLDSLENWNSLAVIGYMALVNDHYGVIVSPRQISVCVTVAQLVDLPPTLTPK
jgi:acyl carrier protein